MKPELTSLPALASFCLALVCGCNKEVPVQSQKARYAAAIREVFAQDNAASKKCKQAVKTNRLEALRAYVQALRQIDLRSCPADFQEAFLKHRYAWDEIIPYLEKYSGFAGDVLGLFEFGVAVIMDRSLTTEGDKEFVRIRKAIASAYFDVEKVGLKYEVQVEY